MGRLTKAQRWRWLLGYMAGGREGESFDVLSREFVEAYEDGTGATSHSTMYGANKCPTLGRDLSEMVAERLLKRARTGIHGMAGMGFPRWVWSYSLTPAGRAALNQQGGRG